MSIQFGNIKYHLTVEQRHARRERIATEFMAAAIARGDGFPDNSEIDFMLKFTDKFIDKLDGEK